MNKIQIRPAPLKAAFFISLVYFCLGVFYLYCAHPYEDPYIIFKYIDNLAHGHGIVYYSGGPHAEGYVDFLWVILLAILVKLKMDVAVGGLVLNAAGAGITAGIFSEALEVSQIPRGTIHRLLSLSVFIPIFFSGALAGYGGFSTMFFCGFVLLLYRIAIEDKPKSVLWIPWLAILVALIRADGLILGLGFLGVGFFQARRMGLLKKYRVNGAYFFGIGAVYFLWRWHYFGHLLPLPLYVKNTGAILKGWDANAAWLLDRWEQNGLYWGILFSLFAVSSLKKKEDLRNLFLGFIPLIFLFLALCFAAQWQNEHMRFQAPIRLVQIFMLFKIGLFEIERAYGGKGRLGGRIAAVISLCIFLVLGPVFGSGFVIIKNNLSFRAMYLDTFAPMLAKRLLPENTLAITEAGRIAYWSQSRVEDMHGLNTYETAVRPPNDDYMERMHPDFMMFQHDGTIDTKVWCCEKDKAYIPITTGQMKSALMPEYREIFERGLNRYQDSKINREKIVPVLLERYLSRHPEYDLYLVLNKSRHRFLNYWHLYALRQDLPQKAAILEDLEKAEKGFYQSYAKLKGFPFS